MIQRIDFLIKTIVDQLPGVGELAYSGLIIKSGKSVEKGLLKEYSRDSKIGVGFMKVAGCYNVDEYISLSVDDNDGYPRFFV